jgi:hypothetical protein
VSGEAGEDSESEVACPIIVWPCASGARPWYYVVKKEVDKLRCQLQAAKRIN